MCGIAGFVDFNGRASEDALARMTDTMIHRGPDAGGYLTLRHDHCVIGLGHRRLAVIDLSPVANQPMQCANGRYRIVFNGEVYNFQAIREELLQKQRQFASRSDTEVILQAYAEWGPAAIDRFVGMFALVIYDTQEGTLFCCRDRAGVKPFFYYWHDGLFLFASELKALMAYPGYPRQIDAAALREYFRYGYVPSPHCIFEHTHKLPPGHWLRLSTATRRAEIRQYWNVYDCYNRRKIDISMPEAISETEKVLERAFEARMVADVPVGVFLSGGYDSTALVALLQKTRTDRIKTFTIGSADARYDEAPHARKIARRLGTDHHEYYCTEKDAIDLVPALPHFYDEPLADTSAIPTMLVSRLARQSVTVALSGDAGDEIFGGYDRYAWMLKYFRRMNAIPEPLRRGGAALVERLPLDRLPGLAGNPALQRRCDKLFSLLANPDPETLYHGMTDNYSPRECDDLLLRSALPRSAGAGSHGLQDEWFDPLTYALARDYQTYMVDDILQKVDRAAMAVSLENREPFLDHRVIAWVGSLPPEYKIFDGKSKYILREITHRYVPRAMMERPKMGFELPVGDWLATSLRPLVETYLGPAYLERQGLFNAAYVDRMRRAFFVRRQENLYKVWFLLMFQLWYARWIESR